MKLILVFTIIYGLLPLLIFYNKRIIKSELRSIYPLLLIEFIASIYELIGSIILKITAEYWFMIYNVLAFFGIHYFFYLLNEKNNKILFLFYILVFVLLQFLFYKVFSEFNFINVNAYLNIFQTLIILTFSILWFRSMFLNLKEENISNNPNFYFVSGLIICYCGTVFLFLMSSSLYAQDKSSFQYYWLLNILLNFVLRSLLIFGVWKARVK